MCWRRLCNRRLAQVLESSASRLLWLSQTQDRSGHPSRQPHASPILAVSLAAVQATGVSAGRVRSMETPDFDTLAGTDVTQVFEANLQALRRMSPVTAREVEAASPPPEVRFVRTPGGHAVLELGGRALDSRRQPVDAARRQAAAVTATPVVVAGLGGGYLAEALLDRGTEVAAIVESDVGLLRASLEARDLRHVVGRVPIVLTAHLGKRAELARLRRRARAILPHAPSLSVSASLCALVEGWEQIRVCERRPRVLVVGPIYGGSLGVAAVATKACARLGAATRLFDASAYATARTSLDTLAVSGDVRGRLIGGLVELLGDAVVALARDWKPDLVLALAQAPMTPSAVDRLRGLGITTAFWFVENSRVLQYWREVAARYDWFYAIQPGAFLERLAELGAANPRYLAMACDPEVHRPLTLDAGDQARYGSDVSFAGAPYLNRIKLFPALMDVDFRIWGPGWNQTALSRHVAEGGHTFTTDEMVRIFCATRINLNLHSANHVAGLDPEPDYVNPRTFELAACGAFQLVDERVPLRDLFERSEVVSFASVAELRDEIAFYLSHETERAAISARARARALNDHSYEKRIRQVLDDTLAPDLAAAAERLPDAEPLTEALKRYQRESPAMPRAETLARVVKEVEATWAAR